MPRKTRDGLYRTPDSPYWYASYADASGRRVRRTTQTKNKTEAQALLAKWRTEVHHRRHYDREPDRYYDEIMAGYLKETQANHASAETRIAQARHLTAVFSGRKIASITPTDIRQYRAQQRQAGFGVGTVNKQISLLSMAIKHARDVWGYRIDNPCIGTREREPEGIVRWLRQDEAQRLLEAAANTPKSPHLYDLILLALSTGMRKGELLGLEWQRVNMTGRLLVLETMQTKTRRRRSVPINDNAYSALCSRARFRAEHCPASPWVFAHRNGERVKDTKAGWRSALARAGIEGFRFHDLRHTCAAWLVTAGVPLMEVRDLLGHQTIAMTERYAHLAPDNVRAAVAKLDLIDLTKS